MLRNNYTAIVEEHQEFTGPFETEPYECGWAREAIFFVRKLSVEDDLTGTTLRVQISPDGMRWCDEGSALILSAHEVDFCRVRHVGNWLRLAGAVPAGTRLKVLVALSLKE